MNYSVWASLVEHNADTLAGNKERHGMMKINNLNNFPRYT